MSDTTTYLSLVKPEITDETVVRTIYNANLDLIDGAVGGLHIRSGIIQKASKQLGTPTEIYKGCNVGYSFPVYDSDDEELFFRMLIPSRWDGTTDPQFEVLTTIMGIEDIGDKYKFQFEWQITGYDGTSTMGETTSNCVSEQTVISGGTAAYSAYRIVFTLDADDATNPLENHDMLQCRLRRIAASANEVTAEIGVWDWATYWKTNKIYNTHSVHENVS